MSDGIWLPTAERIANPFSNGGTYVDDPEVPWRFVAHTVQGEPRTIAAARSMIADHDNPPHLWYMPRHRWLAQTVRLDRSARALLQPDAPGSLKTNKMKAIQLEIFGYAEDTPRWPAAWWRSIGEDVLVPLIKAGFDIDLRQVAATTGNDGYGVRGKVRMTWTAWLHFGGVCCHANVPGNSHWDIGKGDLWAIANAANEVLNPAPEEEEEEMANKREITWFKNPNHPDPKQRVSHAYLVSRDGLTAKHLTQDGLDAALRQAAAGKDIIAVNGAQNPGGPGVISMYALLDGPLQNVG